MDSFSHNLLGKILLRHLEETYDIALERRSFLYGSVMPDFRRYYKCRPHRHRYWENHLKSEIHKLAAHKQSSRSFGRDYSRRLGVICHFYADFFCYAHTDVYDGGFYGHFKYEWMLGRRMRENADNFYRADLGIKPLAIVNPETIYGDFILMQSSYLQRRPDYMLDLTFALRACLGTISALAESSVVEAEEPPVFGELVAQTSNG